MSYLIRVAEAPLSAGGYDLHRSASLLAGRIVDEISITPCETRPSLVRVTVELDPWQKPEGKADSFLAGVDPLETPRPVTPQPYTVAHDAMRLEQIAQSLAEIEDRYNFAETSRPGWGARVPSIEMAFNALLDIHRQRLRPPPAASARPRSEKA